MEAGRDEGEQMTDAIERLRMVLALCKDQLRMHKANGDGMDVWGRVESIECEATAALEALAAEADDEARCELLLRIPEVPFTAYSAVCSAMRGAA